MGEAAAYPSDRPRQRDNRGGHETLPPSVVGLKEFSALVRADGDPVIDGVYSRSCPYRSLRLFPFAGRSDLSGQRHDVSVRGNADLLCVNFGTAFESRLDVGLDGRPADWRLQGHKVGDAFDPSEISDRFVDGIALVLRVDVSFQGHR